jgi:hypothetical protein
MRFSIDVAFVDAAGIIVAVRSNITPWRVVMPEGGAMAAIETRTSECPLASQQKVAIAGVSVSALPNSIRFLAARD